MKETTGNNETQDEARGLDNMAAPGTNHNNNNNIATNNNAVYSNGNYNSSNSNTNGNNYSQQNLLQRQSSGGGSATQHQRHASGFGGSGLQRQTSGGSGLQRQASSGNGFQRQASSGSGMGGMSGSTSAGRLRRSSTEASVGGISEDGWAGFQTKVTPYERLSMDLSSDQRVIKEITLGRRIAFYRIRGEIGSGNFSQVKLGIHALTKEKVAIKILDKTKLDQKTQRLLSREITSMERLHHPNIIRLYEVVETLAKLHIIMEYAGGGELFNKISSEGRLPEPDAKCIFSQIVSALDHMHEKNIIHRDLKAENVFYASSNWVKIGDFGFSTIARSHETLNTFCGSPPYAAPELFKDEHYYGVFVDIWALGILLYFIVTGLMPFRAETVAKLKKCILDGSYTVPSYVSDSCVFLIRSILKHIPQDRFTLAEIRRSEWLDNQDFPESLDPYNLNPSQDIRSLSDEEREARTVLSNLGINEEHLRKTSVRDSRNSIIGTYRIVLHRIQKKGSIQEITPDLIQEHHRSSRGSSSVKRRSRKSTALSKFGGSKPQSKTCSIL